MSKTHFNWFGDDWRRVKNHCRRTDNKDFTDNDATDTFKKKLLLSEHSPIRLIEFDWTWKGIKYWLSTEYSRHKFEKFISTSRDDRVRGDSPFGNLNVWDSKTKSEVTYTPNSRDDIPEKYPVNFDGYANMQNLIDAWKKRLCECADPQAVELAEDFKATLHETHPIESNVLVPTCIYRWACSEFVTCGKIHKFIKWCKDNNKDLDPLDLQRRYDLYNEWFYELRDEINDK